MQTLLLNAVLIVFGVLLLSGPGLAVALRGRPTAVMLTGASCLTLVGVSLVTYVVSLAGYGAIAPLRVCAVLLALVLVWDAVQAFRLQLAIRGRRRSWVGGPDVLALPLGLAIGIWAMAPPLLALGRMGERFGLASPYNADIANYALAADNVARAGFQDSNHLAGYDLGAFSQHSSYMGPTALIILMSAATGLASWQVLLAVMGVAVSLSAVALWALVKAVWPTARNAAAAAVIVASLAGLSSYLIGEYFLGGVLALTSVATSLAGATLLGRADPDSRVLGVCAAAGGGALGIYSYGHLGLPIVVLLPFWSMVVFRLTGDRPRTGRRQAALWSVSASGLALVLSAIAVPTAFSLLRAQSTVAAGWPAPAMGADVMLLWPAGIRQHSNTVILFVSWLAVITAVALGLAASWRRGMKDSVRVSAVFATASIIVCLGCILVYGADRYQTWKMESFLLPLAIALCIPALIALRFGSRRLGAGLVLLTVGAVALGPALTWQAANDANVTGPNRGVTDMALAAQNSAGMFTPPGLVNLATSPELSHVSNINIRLGSIFETMSAGAIVPGPVVVIFSSRTYYESQVSLSTCTLTRRDMLTPGDTSFTDLGGGYVLLQRPNKCAMNK